MPSLKDFIFTALGGKKPPVYNFGFKETVDVPYFAPTQMEDYPDEETMRKIWLGTKTEPPSGTHTGPVTRIPEWRRYGKRLDPSTYTPDQKDPDVKNTVRDVMQMDQWKRALGLIQKEYPYATSDVEAVDYNPEAAEAKGAIGFMPIADGGRRMVLGKADASLDPYKTLMHELVHSKQFAAFPTPQNLTKAPPRGWIPPEKDEFFRTIEAPAYVASGEGFLGRKMLAKRQGKESYDELPKYNYGWQRR